MIRTIIIENEINASNALTALLNAHCNEVKIIGTYPNIDGAILGIHQLSPDLVFLDVELDGESGFDLFEKIGDPDFEVVFTTAYSHYAIRAIKHACLEYLLKPIDVDGLKTVIQKFNKRKMMTGFQQQVQILLQNLKKPNEPRLCIPVSDGFIYLKKSEIIMCRAEANYCLIQTSGEKIMCSKNLGFIEEMIDDDNFFRCHKSYLINLFFIKKILHKEGLYVLMEGGLKAELSVRKKDELHERMDSRKNQSHHVIKKPLV